MTTENNEVRIFGIKPAHDSDDFPVKQANPELLQLKVHLAARITGTTNYTTVLCDANGKLILDSASMVAALYAAKPCFHCKLIATQFNVTGDDTLYNLTGAIWTEIKDQGNNFLNGTFTASDTGIYLFSGLIGLDGILGAHTYGYATLVTSNRDYYFFSANPGVAAGANTVYIPFSLYVDMDATDTAYLNVRVYNGARVVDVTLYTFFGGSRII